MTLPWGKYRGQPLDAVPATYLAWILEEATSATRALRAAVRDALAARLDLEPALPAPVQPPADVQPLIAEMLRQGYRAVARQAHPDVGGATATMQAVNNARDWARAHGLL